MRESFDLFKMTVLKTLYILLENTDVVFFVRYTIKKGPVIFIFSALKWQYAVYFGNDGKSPFYSLCLNNKPSKLLSFKNY